MGGNRRPHLPNRGSGVGWSPELERVGGMCLPSTRRSVSLPAQDTCSGTLRLHMLYCVYSMLLLLLLLLLPPYS